jgi:hypothetical protein
MSASSPIIPDGYFELSTLDKTLACFLEVDLGTETSKVWTSKIEVYVRYAASEEFEQRFHLSRFRVLVVTSSQRRVEMLRRLALHYTDRIFWFATVTSVKDAGFWSAVWLRPDGTEMRSFL